MNILEIFLSFVAAFIATAGFSTIFNIPKNELGYCGLIGGVGWILFQLQLYFIPNALILATFFGAILITCVSRVLAFARKVPMTIFLVGGIIPLVPGTGIYHTMYNMVIGENSEALAKGIETLKVSGVIGIGIIVVLSLPWGFFRPAGESLQRFFDKRYISKIKG